MTVKVNLSVERQTNGGLVTSAITTEKRHGGTAKDYWKDATRDAKKDENIPRYTRRGDFLAASNLLAADVLNLLNARGITAAERPAMTDPEQPKLVTTSDDPRTDRVISITIHVGDDELILPICPGAATLHLYRLTSAEQTNKFGDPEVALVTAVPIPREKDGWTPATMIVDAIHDTTRTLT